VLLLLLACAAGGGAARAEDPSLLLESIRSTSLDTGRAVALRDTELPLGIATLEVERGILIPTRPIEDRTVEFAFVGQARFHCDPPDDIEAGQLELFTGRPFLDAPLEKAILVITDRETVDGLLQRPAPMSLLPDLIKRAQHFHADWLQKTERRNTGVESAIFRALAGDAAFGNYFAIWARSHELGDFVYQLDPEDNEPLTVGSFIPIDIRGWERMRLGRHLRIQQRKGRWLGVRVEDLGAWDVWLSAPWTPAGDRPLPGNLGFESRRYTLDVTIRRRSLRLEGTARLELEALADGRLAVPLELFRDLVVERVVDGQGRQLFSFRSGAEVVVLLAEPTRTGDLLTLDVTYSGHALKWVGRRTFDLLDTGTWYPHCGVVDRARYDVTLHWPKRYELVAGGRRVEHGRHGKYLWERRVLEEPSLAFSFVLGDFIVERRQSDDVELVVAFNRYNEWRATDESRRRVMDTVEESLRFFEELYGPYPLDRLVVATLPREYSQSYLGFITLADSVARPDTPRGEETLRWLRDNLIAHEVSHQWWGNLLGWWSYRDQWLSEGMANYSGLLFYVRNSPGSRSALAESSALWRDSLTRLTLGGRTIESLGPVVLGARLNSSLASNGYRAIVYRKGAVVLAMLARTMGEERFLEMMRALLDAARFQVISTEDFLAALEHMSETDLKGFARRYVYGTGIPRVYYDYSTEAGLDDDWILRGEAHWLATPRYTQRVERGAAGRWESRREAHLADTGAGGGLIVPFHLVVDGGLPAAGDSSGQDSRTVRAGMVSLEEDRSRFEIVSEETPLELRLDPLGEILAYFHSAKEHPRRVARYRAQNLAAAGRLEEAEAAFREALELPPDGSETNDTTAWPAAPQTPPLQEEARIRLALARLYLDRRMEDEAQAELGAVEALMEGDDHTQRMERDVLRSRLEIARGEYAPAYRRLKKTLKLQAPRETARGWRATLWRVRLRSERLAMTEAYALLAVAAWETGHLEDARWALREARERGAEMTALAEMIDPRRL
jgi:tetratricopeptide (TPR) repeat protein